MHMQCLFLQRNMVIRKMQKYTRQRTLISNLLLQSFSIFQCSSYPSGTPSFKWRQISQSDVTVCCGEYIKQTKQLRFPLGRGMNRDQALHIRIKQFPIIIFTWSQTLNGKWILYWFHQLSLLHCLLRCVPVSDC